MIAALILSLMLLPIAWKVHLSVYDSIEKWYYQEDTDKALQDKAGR